MKSTTSGSTPALQTQVSNLNVAIQAVRDKLAQQNTYVNFGGTTTVDGIDANGQTGFAWVNNGSWNFLTNPEATAKLSLFSSTAKGLVASPGTATGKFLSDDGTWQVVDTSIPLGSKGDITVVAANDWQIASGVVSTTELGGDITAAGKALLDDANTAAQRTTLGLGSLATQNGTFSGTSSGTNTGDQLVFNSVAVSGQNSVQANLASDTLTLIAGTNVVIVTDSSAKSVTFSAVTSGNQAMTWFLN